jgi:hypothetical protein
MSDEEFSEYLQKVDAGIKAGVALALDEHRRMGHSIVNWEDGKMVVRTGEEIPVRLPDEAHRHSR